MKLAALHLGYLQRIGPRLHLRCFNLPLEGGVTADELGDMRLHRHILPPVAYQSNILIVAQKDGDVEAVSRIFDQIVIDPSSRRRAFQEPPRAASNTRVRRAENAAGSAG